MGHKSKVRKGGKGGQREGYNNMSMLSGRWENQQVWKVQHTFMESIVIHSLSDQGWNSVWFIKNMFMILMLKQVEKIQEILQE